MKKTILIADDSESVREVVSFTLINAGYNVLVREDAMKFLDGKEIHLVIKDLHMPKKDDIALIKKIRGKSDYQYVPILFPTIESQAAKKDEAKAAGATGWIVKPFVPEKLISTIEKVIR
ncbi:MAG: response regulator [Sporocytophaga sp.]|uniref:response regulator n=1 Tax=Sporocytophaga sp. TaxID=2231183 RepID=UPI001B09E252|nr:response regulator [Sporocytophaga sp.]MBO9703164.1 response regulator [Sporocytophaga sp.]